MASPLTTRRFFRLPPGQEIEPRQLSPHFVDRVGAKSLLLKDRVDAIEKICKHHGDNVQVVEKLHKLCLAVEQDGVKVPAAALPRAATSACAQPMTGSGRWRLRAAICAAVNLRAFLLWCQHAHRCCGVNMRIVAHGAAWQTCDRVVGVCVCAWRACLRWLRACPVYAS